MDLDDKVRFCGADTEDPHAASYCDTCGEELTDRECEACEGDGAGMSNGFDDPRGECNGCDGEGTRPYCPTCGEYKD
jgi:hypothetical protein